VYDLPAKMRSGGRATGFCRARENRGGKVVCGNYARVTALSLDPIEKKPLKRFFPGTRILLRRQLRLQPRLPVLPKQRHLNGKREDG
jgi:hypothetical protein